MEPTEIERKMLFSIVTVVLNDRAGLNATRASVLKQDASLWEHIIIDGASTDGSRELAEIFATENRNTFVISERDEGIYDAMNKGVKSAHGDYIVFMNAGDCFATSNVLSMVSDIISMERYDFIYGDCYERGNFGECTYKTARGHLRLDQGMFANHQSMYFRHDFVVANRIEYRQKYKVGGDYAYVATVLKCGASVYYLHEPLCVFQMNGLSNRQKNIGRLNNWDIQRDILNLNIVTRVLNQIRYRISSFISDYFPRLYRFIRYDSSN